MKIYSVQNESSGRVQKSEDDLRIFDRKDEWKFGEIFFVEVSGVYFFREEMKYYDEYDINYCLFL